MVMENQNSTIQSSAQAIGTDVSSLAHSAPILNDELASQTRQKARPAGDNARFDNFLKRNKKYQSKSLKRMEKMKEYNDKAQHQ